MKIRIILILLIALISASAFKPKPGISGNVSLPKPEGIDNMLFYIQRTINANTIVYALNLDKSGNPDENEPIKVFWLKYDQGGKIDPLTYIQKNYAYGIQAKLIDKERKVYSFEFVSYDKKQFYLLKSNEDNKYHVYGYINDRMAILSSIFVKIEGGTFWVPNVKYVEVKAIDPKVSSEMSEIIKP